MGGRKKSKKRKADTDNDRESVSDSSVGSENEDKSERYKPFRVESYTRQYPEDGGNFEYLVIIESEDPLHPIGKRDMMTLGNTMKRHNKGIKRFKRINKYKIGAVFERPGLANLATNNKTFLKENKIKATIPAAFTEVTGVIKNVPKYISNKDIYKGLNCSKDIVSVRRFMRRVIKDEEGYSPGEYIPTPSVSITFACPILPHSVDINSWLFEVSPYTPPVTQCLKCLRYGHIAKYCKNSQRCSICGENHHYKECNKDTKDALCIHCQGNHVAISADCPIKKKKIDENKNKTQKPSFTSLFDEKSFPSLKKPNLIESLMNSSEFMNLLVESVVKIISQSKDKENSSICSKSIKSILLDTFNKKTNTQSQ